MALALDAVKGRMEAMIRFILKRTVKECGVESVTYETVAMPLSRLEEPLTRGGYDTENDRYDVTELLGVEIAR